MALVVDRFRPDDLAAGLRLSTQAGWNQTAADWRRALEVCPDGLLAGRLDGRVVATGCVASFGQAATWIGLILVDEAQRGRGFGGDMFRRTIELAKQIGGDAIGLDASDLGRPVYLRQGFFDVAPIDRWSGVLRPTMPTAALEPIATINWEKVADVDRAACGVDRTPLLRHLLADPAVHGFSVPGAGHALLYPGRLHTHLGPVVAADDAVFARLLSRAAEVLDGFEVVVDVLRTPANSAVLKAHGLQVQRRLTRMTLSRPQPLLMGPAVRAAVSFTFG